MTEADSSAGVPPSLACALASVDRRTSSSATLAHSASIERSALSPGTSRASLYFAHPYSAFERGTSENANRIIRRFIPKGSDIGDFSPAKIQAIEDWMNRLPRESLDGKTAAEAQREQLNKLAA